MKKMKINKNKLKVGYIFEDWEGYKIITSINKKYGEVFVHKLEEEGDRYEIEKDGGIEVYID
jgi:hypothetical protein